MNPPPGIKQLFIDSYAPRPEPNDKLRLVVETYDTGAKATKATVDPPPYVKSGIYLAQRDDTAKPVIIDWGDGTVEQVNGDVSQKTHTYASYGTFNVVVENIKSYSAQKTTAVKWGSNWDTSESQNNHTLKEVAAIPFNMTSILDTSFNDCSCLVSITVPDSITSIGSSAFSNCSSLTAVTILANDGNAQNVKQMMIDAGVLSSITWNMPR